MYGQMKERGLDIRRLKLTAICSVCTKAFVKEIGDLAGVVEELGPITVEPARKPEPVGREAS